MKKLKIADGELGAILLPWYIREPERLEAEKEGMETFFPQFKLNKMDDGRYYWRGTLRPGVLPDGWAWEVAAIYDNAHPNSVFGGAVKIVLLEPEIETVIEALGWRPYSLIDCPNDGIYLCTAMVDDMKNSHTKYETTAVQTLARAVKWLTALELVMAGDLSEEWYNEPVDMKQIVFTRRAFNAIVTETIDKNPDETAGALIGRLLQHGVWIVVDTVPARLETKEQQTFEYDMNLINSLANGITKQYSAELSVIGYWRRYPDSVFPQIIESISKSETTGYLENETLSVFVNCVPEISLKTYHIDTQYKYTEMDWIVSDEYIPEHILEYKFNGLSELPDLKCNNENN